jgi:hypothetical protein
MISYNVFFTPKAGVEDRVVIAAARRFLETLKAEKKLRDYRILHVTDPASFPALPRFQLIADYETQQELDDSFAFMKQPGRIKEGPHGELVALVADFKVSFTADV